MLKCQKVKCKEVAEAATSGQVYDDQPIEKCDPLTVKVLSSGFHQTVPGDKLVTIQPRNFPFCMPVEFEKEGSIS